MGVMVIELGREGDEFEPIGIISIPGRFSRPMFVSIDEMGGSVGVAIGVMLTEGPTRLDFPSIDSKAWWLSDEFFESVEEAEFFLLSSLALLSLRRSSSLLSEA